MKLIVKEAAQREGIGSAYELANKTGIPINSMYRIWNGRATMIALETLDRLCTVLNVKPGQLFEHEAEPEKLPGGTDSGQTQRRSKKPSAKV